MDQRDETARHPIRWFFEDRTTGRIVVAQKPNVLLWIVIGSWLGRHTTATGSTTGAMFAWVMTITLGLWALDEIVTGVNPWRRLLGAGTLVYAFATHP